MSLRKKPRLVSLKKLVRKAKRLGLTMAPMVPLDARGLFVAYQKGAFRGIPNLPDNFEPQEFIEFLDNIQFVTDVFVAKRSDSRPIAVALIAKGSTAQAQVFWAPWASVRHRVLTAVIFLGRVGRTRGIVLHVSEKDLKFVHNVARRGVLSRIGALTSVKRDENFVAYQARDNPTDWLEPLYVEDDTA